MLLHPEFKVRPVLTALFLSIFTISMSAQEWIYEGPKDFPNGAGNSWLDEAGNSYHNISESKIKETFGQVYTKSLLILDKHGNFNGRVQINACRNRATLLPYHEGMYLTNDYNCDEKTGMKKDSRVFNHKGNLILTGEGYGLNHFASVKTQEGYTIFSIKSFSTESPVMEIRKIDWDFNIEDKQIDLSELKLPEKKMTADQTILPVQTQEGHWVVKMSYGILESKKSMRNEHDFLILTDEKSVLNKILFKENYNAVNALQSIGKDIAVVIGPRRDGPRKVILLDQSLQVKQELTLPVEGYFDRFLITQQHIILLNINHDWGQGDGDRYVMYVFDREGNLLQERLLKKNRVVTRSLLAFGENSILLAGASLVSDSQHFSLIWKLDILPVDSLENSEASSGNVARNTSPSPVADWSVEKLDTEAMSVAVFPNPASIYINFALKNPEAGQQDFLLRVFSMDGKEMHQAHFQNAFYELDIAHFPPGTYSYLIVNQADQKEFLSGKFIKNR